MTFRQYILASAAFISLGTIAQAQTNLSTNFDRFLTFEDPAQCQYDLQFEKFLFKLYDFKDGLAIEGIVDFPAPYSEGYISHDFARGSDGAEMVIHTNGIWNGFPLLEIGTWQYDSDYPPLMSWKLAGDHDAITAKLRALGFIFDENGHAVQNSPISEYDLYFYVKEDNVDPNITEISCYWL